jgi:N-acetylglucosamine-6-phosphate deacetylase
MIHALRSTHVFDGQRLVKGGVTISDGRVVAVGQVPVGVPVTDLAPGIITPGFVDLQVNGGDGLMLNDSPTVSTLERMATAHARLGATTILPTLITDTPAQVTATIAAVAAAVGHVDGIAGLHLEGPHLSVARKGAHDPGLIRPMTDADLAELCAAAARFPLMVTVAPESVSPAQVQALTSAKVIVSIGHTDGNLAQATALADAGASVVTHLFNAMKPLENREPALVGAALTLGGLSCGLIADGIHVHPSTMRVAVRAKQGPGRVFLVSDAMATAGSLIDHFQLNGRTILRRAGRLTLADGTLAGADLTLPQALRVMVGQVGIDLAEALAMATAVPAEVMGLAAGRLSPGDVADMVHLTPDLQLGGVWRGGIAIAPASAPT